MEKLFEKLFDIKRIPSKLFLALLISCSIILFVPDIILQKLNLNDFLKEYGKFIGITFIVSLAFLIVSALNYLSKKLSYNKLIKKREKEIIKSVSSLNIHEKANLREFFIQQKSSLQLPIDDETVAGLSDKGIIYQTANIGSTYGFMLFFPYSITEFALKNLSNSLLDLPENATPENLQRILDNRPEWAKDKNMLGINWEAM
jgi:hypothetical protein